MMTLEELDVYIWNTTSYIEHEIPWQEICDFLVRGDTLLVGFLFSSAILWYKIRKMNKAIYERAARKD